MPSFSSNVAKAAEFSALLELGLTEVHKMDMKHHQRLWREIMREQGQEEFTEDERVFSGLGSMPRKGIGEPFQTAKPILSSPKDFTIETFGLGFTAEHELMQWEQYGCFAGMTKQLGRGGNDRKNITAYGPFNNGFSTADEVYTTYAGEALFATDHALLRGGTGKNHPATAAGLSYLTAQEALTDFQLLTDEDGIFQILTLQTIVCNPALDWIVEELLDSSGRPDTADNATNTLKGKVKKRHYSPYIVSQVAYFFLAAKGDHYLKFSLGEELHVRRDFDFSTWNTAVNMYGAWLVRVLHWFGSWGSPGQ